jgi:hypothetical protein
MTWKEFKDKVEEEGVTDESEIDYIDISSFSEINISHFTQDGWGIWN